MKVKAWKGGGYGIRVGKPNAAKSFPKRWTRIFVIMGGQSHTFKLTSTFWTTCPEFRGKTVERWLGKRNAKFWAYGKPPVFTLTKMHGRRFRLH